MKKLALALATTAALGFAAPAFAADDDMSGTKAQTQTPAGQTTSPSAQTQSQTSTPSTQAQTPSPTQTPSAQNQTRSMQNSAAAQTELKGKAKSKVSAKANKAKMAQHRRGTTHLARHDRGFKHGHYYAYVKPHHKSVHHSKTMTQH
jgi:hypothetical protein